MAKTARIIDGKAFAARLRQDVAAGVAALAEERRVTPGLAVVLVGENPASEVYVRNKSKHAQEVGMAVFDHPMPASATHQAVLAKVEALNADAAVHGILVQLPLPDQVGERAVLAAVKPAKDVDGFHVINAGRLMTGEEGMVPCTPFGCLLMLKDTLGDLKGKRALVLGRSNIVGKPMAMILLREHCTVTVAHSRTQDLAGECRRADILVVAAGRPEMVRGDWIKPGAAVIDVGINRIPAEGGKTRLVGDVCFPEAARVAGAITPVPGGVGPMTIACLLQNTLTAAQRQHRIEEAQD